jgi:hypothetical protein
MAPGYILLTLVSTQAFGVLGLFWGGAVYSFFEKHIKEKYPWKSIQE